MSDQHQWHRELWDALVDAFPSYDSLSQMVLFGGLSQSPEAITGNGDLGARAFALIQWALAHNRETDLLTAALEFNSSNLRLKAIASRHHACFWVGTRLLLVSPSTYPSFAKITTALFRFLQRLPFPVSAYTYGKEWIVVGGLDKTHVLAPFQWITHSDSEIRRVAPRWSGSQPPANLRITPGSDWFVLLKRDNDPNWPQYLFGIAADHQPLLDKLYMGPKALDMLLNRHYLVPADSTAQRRSYQYEYVFSDRWGLLTVPGGIFCQSDKAVLEDL